MHSSFKRIFQRCTQFAEKQGFPLIVTICVAVITASALWTGKREAPYVSPTPPVNQDVSAAQLIQESLRSIATSTPAPTAASVRWIPPMKDYQILREFDTTAMQQSSITGIWQIHAGVDLSAKPGEPVYAMSRGTILSNGKDDLRGVWYCIDHEDVQVLYAGMIAAGGFIAGDIIEAGDTLGFVGSGLLEESNMEPHLHLEATKAGMSIDPLTLWDAN